MKPELKQYSFPTREVCTHLKAAAEKFIEIKRAVLEVARAVENFKEAKEKVSA